MGLKQGALVARLMYKSANSLIVPYRAQILARI